MTKKYQTINTFHRTPSPSQIISYILIILQTCILYIMIIPSFQSQTTKVVFWVLYSLNSVGLVVSVVICSCIDPSDTVMIQCRNGQASKFSSNLSQLLFCEHCQTYVQLNSRHCRKCDRCVQEFDHHCVWINNCIGTKNYRPFFGMIILAFTQTSLFVIATILLATQDQWKSDYLGFMIIGFIFMVVIGILAVLVFNLILLHIYLSCKGYTTYEFIKSRRDAQRLQEQEQQKLKNQKHASKLKETLQKQHRQLQQKYMNFNKQNYDKPKISQIHPRQQLPNFPVQTERQIDQTHSKIVISQTKGNINQSNLNYQQQSNRRPNKILISDQNVSNSQQGVKQSNLAAHHAPRAHLNEVNSSNQICSFSSNKQKMSIQQKASQKSKISSSIAGSDEERSIRMSHFFIKNKSLSLLLFNDESIKPNISALNRTQMVEGANINSNPIQDPSDALKRRKIHSYGIYSKRTTNKPKNLPKLKQPSKRSMQTQKKLNFSNSQSMKG